MIWLLSQVIVLNFKRPWRNSAGVQHDGDLTCFPKHEAILLGGHVLHAGYRMEAHSTQHAA